MNRKSILIALALTAFTLSEAEGQGLLKLLRKVHSVSKRRTGHGEHAAGVAWSVAKQIPGTYTYGQNTAREFVQPPREDVTYHSGPVGAQIVKWVQAAGSLDFSGTVLAAKDGKVIAAVAVGSADLQGKVPNTPATLFEIASATKQFTAAAAMRLVQEKRLGLDDSIAAHLPRVPEDCRAITVRHLLQHTSGIPGDNYGRGGNDLDVPLFLKGGPKHRPGTHWEYWNQGYALASEIIARAARMDYTAYCKSALFGPSGMQSTRFTGDDPPRISTVAVGRSTNGKPRSALDHPYGSYGFQYRGMGGVVSNVWDLWRWDRTLTGNWVLGSAARTTLFQPGLGDYALGWFVKKNSRGRLVQSHGGGVRGFGCDIRRYPDEDAVLIVLSNRDDFHVPLLAKALEAILFGEPHVNPPRPLDTGSLARIAGKYRDKLGARLGIHDDKGVTRARIEWYPQGPVTLGLVGTDDKGNVVFYEWTSAIKLTDERVGIGRAKRLSLLDRAFTRIP